MSATTRRRVSRRAYMVRRLVALGVVLLVAFGLVKVADAVVGGGDSVADADGPTATSANASGATVEADGDVAAAGPAAAGSVPAGSTPDGVPATEAPADTGPPTPENPARVYIVGDSDAGTFGPYLETLLDGTGLATTELNYKVSSGLARPDFFDWPAELDAKLPAADPDIAVVTFGGNDAQPLSVADGEFIIGDPVDNEAAWVAEYQQRAGAVMDRLLATGAAVIWVGIPNDDNPEVTARMAIQDRAARAAAAERPEVVFIDTWNRFSGRDGGWAEFVIDPRDGQGKDVRADDGFHLNTDGAEILALDIAQAVRDELRARGASI